MTDTIVSQHFIRQQAYLKSRAKDKSHFIRGWCDWVELKEQELSQLPSSSFSYKLLRREISVVCTEFVKTLLFTEDYSAIEYIATHTLDPQEIVCVASVIVKEVEKLKAVFERCPTLKEYVDGHGETIQHTIDHSEHPKEWERLQEYMRSHNEREKMRDITEKIAKIGLTPEEIQQWMTSLRR